MPSLAGIWASCEPEDTWCRDCLEMGSKLGSVTVVLKLLVSPERGSI